MTAAEIRPRGETLIRFAAAQARTAAGSTGVGVLVAGAVERLAPVGVVLAAFRALRPLTRRPARMKGAKVLRSLLACLVLRSIWYVTPSSEKVTVSLALVPSMSSCRVVRTFWAPSDPSFFNQPRVGTLSSDAGGS
jgi:hypothetical protein